MSETRESEVSIAVVRDSALRMLSSRELSKKQLYEKLKRRYGECQHITVVVEELSSQGLQDDARFCELFVRSKIARGQGAMRIGYELRQAGVSEELISVHLQRDDEEWLSESLRVAERKLGDKPLDWNAQQKLSRFLMQRGFASDIVRQTIKSLLRDRNDS